MDYSVPPFPAPGSPSLASESSFGSAGDDGDFGLGFGWDALDSLRAENEALKLQLGRLLGGTQPDISSLEIPATQVETNNQSMEGVKGPAAVVHPANPPAETQSSTLKITLPSNSVPLIKDIISAILQNGNAPLTPAQIAWAIREQADASSPPKNLGHLFDADPASTTNGAIHSLFTKAKAVRAHPILAKVKDGQRSRYFVDIVPGIVPKGTVAVFQEANEDEKGFEKPELVSSSSAGTGPGPVASSSALSTSGPSFATSSSSATAPANALPETDDPLFSLLSHRELTLCRQINLSPSVFVAASTALEDECKRHGGLREKEAAAMVSWHAWKPEQWTPFWGFLLRWNCVWLRMKKRGRRLVEDSSDEEEGGLFPAVPFYRTVDKDGVTNTIYPRENVNNRNSHSSYQPASNQSQTGKQLLSQTAMKRMWNRSGGSEPPPPKRLKTGLADDLVVKMADGSVYRMTCPHCGKTQFHNLQGFVNHVRISHNRYFPTHSQAVISCGTKLSETDPVTLLEEEEDPIETNTKKLIKKQGLGLGDERGASPAVRSNMGGGLRKFRRDGVEVRMICPECGRDDILSMQGFLKHIATHGLIATVKEAIERYGIPDKDGAGSAMVTDTEDERSKVEESVFERGQPRQRTPEKMSFIGAGANDLVITRGDGSYGRVVCPDCGRANFANEQAFSNHLTIAHGKTMDLIEAYSHTVEPAPPPLPQSKSQIKLHGNLVPPIFAKASGAHHGRIWQPKLITPKTERRDRDGESHRGTRLRPAPKPLDIATLPGYEELEEDERDLCSVLRLFPETYMAIRRLFIDECRKNNGLGKRAAREMVKMDVNKSSKVWEYLQNRGKVWIPASKMGEL